MEKEIKMGWDYLTCVHGKQEGLDSHDCQKCYEIAKKLGYDVSKGQTYIFTSKFLKTLSEDEKKKLE